MKYLIILTILNTLVIIYLIMSIKSRYYFSFSKQKTFWGKVLFGYLITLWDKNKSTSVFCINIPIRNRHKVELREEIERLMNPKNPNRRYTLNAKFSWLRTWEEVWQFERDYSIVDEKLVKELVSKFVPKEAEED